MYEYVRSYHCRALFSSPGDNSTERVFAPLASYIVSFLQPAVIRLLKFGPHNIYLVLNRFDKCIDQVCSYALQGHAAVQILTPAGAGAWYEVHREREQLVGTH